MGRLIWNFSLFRLFLLWVVVVQAVFRDNNLHDQRKWILLKQNWVVKIVNIKLTFLCFCVFGAGS